MGRMSTERLNELLAVALERRHRQGGLVTPQANPHKPWLPESYWAQQEREVRRQTDDLLDLAEYMREVKLHRQHLDAYQARRSAAELMAEWDDTLPTLQGPSKALRDAGWGRHRMYDLDAFKRPYTPAPPDQMQPVYNNTCQFCHRPITVTAGDTWKDHAGKRICPDRYDGQYDAEHVPDGVDVDDEYDDD